MFCTLLLCHKPFPKQALVFPCLQYKSSENTVGKRAIACNEQFLAHLSTECSVSYCDHSPSVIVCPSTICLLTLASANMNQSSPHFVKMYMTSKARMSFIMELIGPELSELSALELENLPYLTMFTLASANIDQSVPNLATIHTRMTARMSSIMGQIEPENPELFALEFGKFAESDFVYTLTSTNIDESAPNLVKM